MKYSYKWLKELSATQNDPIGLADSVMMHSFEVEEVLQPPEHLRKVVVGEILEVKAHPNADKLSLALVRVREGEGPLHIVCGAKNIAAGDKVPVALPGVTLPGGLTIRETSIRSELSQGMLCAADELGLGDDHGGIYQLPRDVSIGLSIAEAAGISDDSVLDITILSNRGRDALSHVGLAREIAAIEGRDFSYEYDRSVFERASKPLLEVSIEDPNLCKRYACAIMKNVSVGPSPQWMRARLEACGMRPINNVVDVTNYVMLEMGQPMHAFDADLIMSAQKDRLPISVRIAKDGETMTLLDGNPMNLGSENLVIANDRDVLAIAGVMGGLHSGITEKTATIMLESAWFDPVRVRRSRKALGIATESSYRFERDVDPDLAGVALARAIALLRSIAGAEVADAIDWYPKPEEPVSIVLDVEGTSRLLGRDIESEEVLAILNRIGCQTSQTGERIYDVRVPSWRKDLRYQADLIEEVGRISGYERIAAIPLPVPMIGTRPDPTLKCEDDIRTALISLGMDEVFTYSFYAKSNAELCSLDLSRHYSLQNPMNPSQELIRASLFPNVLRKASDNLRYFDEVSIFEVGKAYEYPGEGDPVEKRETVLLRILHREETEGATFFDLKGLVESSLERIAGTSPEFRPIGDSPEMFHPARCARIFLGKSECGVLGEVHPSVARKMGISRRIALCRLDIPMIVSSLCRVQQYSAIERFPVVERDISIAIQPKTYQRTVETAISASGGPNLRDVRLFDDFRKDGQRSLAYHLCFSSGERTLAGAEVDESMQAIFSALEEQGMHARTT